MNYSVFDDEFKEMTVGLSEAKGSVKEAATELDIAPSVLSKWHHKPEFNGDRIKELTIKKTEAYPTCATTPISKLS